MISLAQIPQANVAGLELAEAVPITVLVAISIAFSVGCMVVDPIVVILVLNPIFAPIFSALGLDPVLFGVIITLHVTIGSPTAPFGCDIFTAMAVVGRPDWEMIRGTPPFIVILLIAGVAIVPFPKIALFLRNPGFR